MATETIVAGRLWRNSIIVRMNELELPYTEAPNGNKSSFIIRVNTPRDLKAFKILNNQIIDTIAERQAMAEQRQAAQDASDLATLNLFRKLTFRKPLKTLPRKK